MLTTQDAYYTCAHSELFFDQCDVNFFLSLLLLWSTGGSGFVDVFFPSRTVVRNEKFGKWWAIGGTGTTAFSEQSPADAKSASVSASASASAATSQAFLLASWYLADFQITQLSQRGGNFPLWQTLSSSKSSEVKS